MPAALLFGDEKPPPVTEGSDMRAIVAACVAVGVLWALDVEMNGGRYSAVVQKAIMSVLPR